MKQEQETGMGSINHRLPLNALPNLKVVCVAYWAETCMPTRDWPRNVELHWTSNLVGVYVFFSLDHGMFCASEPTMSKVNLEHAYWFFVIQLLGTLPHATGLWVFQTSWGFNFRSVDIRFLFAIIASRGMTLYGLGVWWLEIQLWPRDCNTFGCYFTLIRYRDFLFYFILSRL